VVSGRPVLLALSVSRLAAFRRGTQMRQALGSKRNTAFAFCSSWWESQVRPPTDADQDTALIARTPCIIVLQRCRDDTQTEVHSGRVFQGRLG
jgi:hypothetical protein